MPDGLEKPSGVLACTSLRVAFTLTLHLLKNIYAD